jgi:thiosulfate/3-mercaptopyruvate sulfurtransferase
VTIARSFPSLEADEAGTRRPLVSTRELAVLMAGADESGAAPLLVLDATVLQVTAFDGHSAYVTGHEQYIVNGHIPGAVFADLLEEFSDAASGLPFTRPGAEQFARAAEAVGVDASSTIVLYDDSFGQWAARLWWIFRSFGFENVLVLDGGLRKWTAEERAVEIGYTPPPASAGVAVTEQDGFWTDASRVHRALDGSEPATLVCGLPYREFTGERGHRPRLGHIPGSLSAPVSRLVDRDTNTFLADDALRTSLRDALESPDPIVAYCAGGIISAANALALSLLGRDDVTIYDGSLAEWAADENAPLTTIAPHE